MKKFALAIALCAATVTPTLAQTANSAPTFSGPHADITVGWNRGTAKDVLPGTGEQRKSGVAVRGSAGYDIAIGDGGIIGAEVGLSSGGRNIEAVRGGSRMTIDPRFSIDAAARVGVKPIQDLLLYGKAGWAMQRINANLSQTSGAGMTERTTEHGFLWGGGAQVALSPNLSLKAEYNRVKFNDDYSRSRIMGGVSYNF